MRLKRRTTILALVCLLAALYLLAANYGGGVRRSIPERQGMDSRHLSLIDSIVNASIAEGDIPGAVVGVVRNGKFVYKKAFGNRAVYPEVEPMTLNTMFDLASVSKPIGTTLAVMQLVEQGKLRLVDSVGRYIPGFKPWMNPKTGEKVTIRVQDLLTHSSGLEAYLPSVEDYLEEFGPGTPDSLMMVISTRIKRMFHPGTAQLYSCLNFITLQHIVENITGERLCDYTQKHVFDALKLKHTTYFPIDLAKCAPTEVQEDGTVLRGQVHDPIARLICLGNAGNAGVFSTVDDLAVICTALLQDGEFHGRRVLSPLTVKRMFEVPAANNPRVARALGWDTFYMEPYTSGDVFPLTELRGHTGYTGVSIILSPETNTAVIILANRVHPIDDGSASRLRSTIATIVAASIGR